MEDGFVTVATYWEPIEANLMRSKLLSEGIECALLDENLISVQPFYSNAIGGIKLQVNEADAEAAMAILNESNQAQMHVVHTNNDSVTEDADENAIHCPECNSTSVYFERLTTGEFFLCILLLGIPLLFIKGKYHCYNCGNKFN